MGGVSLTVLVAVLFMHGVVGVTPSAETNVCRAQRRNESSCCCSCEPIFTDGDFDAFASSLHVKHWVEVVNSEPELIVWKHGDDAATAATAIRAKVQFDLRGSDVDSTVALLTDVEQRLSWDVVTAAAKVTKTCPQHRQKIIHSVMKISLAALDRDFLQVIGERKASGCTVILQRDSPCLCVPVDPVGAVIRGSVGNSGMRVCPLPDGSSGSVVEFLLDYDIGKPATDLTASAQLIVTSWFRDLVNHVNGNGAADPNAAAAKIPYPFHKKFTDELLNEEYKCDLGAGWKTIANKQQIATICFRHWAGTDTFAFKSFYTIPNMTPCEITKILTSYSTRSTWDRTFPKIDVIEKHSHYHVIYWVLGLPPPYVNRDVVLYTTARPLPDGGYVILYKNADKDCRSPVEGLVRAIAYPSAIFVHPQGNGSAVSYNLHMDIGPGIKEKHYEAILRSRVHWKAALTSYSAKVGTASLQSDFDIVC
eukprot:m.306780 g.306780  ORF g.306780 m.306780 type:complete len:478 (+) comp41579_c0_seq1:1014-2447(+)